MIIIVWALISCVACSEAVTVTRELGGHPAVLVHDLAGEAAHVTWRECDFQLWDPVAVVECAHTSPDGCPPSEFRFDASSNAGVVAWMSWDERVFYTFEVSDSRLWVMRDGDVETTAAVRGWPELSFKSNTVTVDGSIVHKLPISLAEASLARCGFGDVPHTVAHPSRVRCGSSISNHPELAKRITSVRLDLYKLFDCDSTVRVFATSEDLFRGNLMVTYANGTSSSVAFQV
jgi:hypothetical protein